MVATCKDGYVYDGFTCQACDPDNGQVWDGKKCLDCPFKADVCTIDEDGELEYDSCVAGFDYDEDSEECECAGLDEFYDPETDSCLTCGDFIANCDDCDVEGIAYTGECLDCDSADFDLFGGLCYPIPLEDCHE